MPIQFCTFSKNKNWIWMVRLVTANFYVNYPSWVFCRIWFSQANMCRIELWTTLPLDVSNQRNLPRVIFSKYAGKKFFPLESSLMPLIPPLLYFFLSKLWISYWDFSRRIFWCKIHIFICPRSWDTEFIRFMVFSGRKRQKASGFFWRFCKKRLGFYGH